MQRGSDLIDATFAYVNFFREVAQERRQNPKDDLASIIATAEVEGRPIGELETSSYYVALASAGHDTTSATLSGGLLALIENPAEMRKLRDKCALGLSGQALLPDGDRVLYAARQNHQAR